MLERPLITRSFAQPLAVLHQTVPRAEIRNVMGPGLAEVRNVVVAQGIEITGPWLTHHLQMDPEVFDFEICLPVASPIAATGRVRPGVSHAAWVAQTVYQGGYEGLGAAWGEFIAWMEGEGHTPAEDLWEVYLAGPEASDDPAMWRTQLTRALTS